VTMTVSLMVLYHVPHLEVEGWEVSMTTVLATFSLAPTMSIEPSDKLKHSGKWSGEITYKAGSNA